MCFFFQFCFAEYVLLIWQNTVVDERQLGGVSGIILWDTGIWLS